MKTKRVYFDETLINAFMEFSRDYIRTPKIDTKWLQYMNDVDVKTLATYFTNRSDKYSCNNKGEAFEGSEKIVWTPTKIRFLDGRILENPNEIIQWEQQEFENNYNEYIKWHLLHLVWCKIEGILRVNHMGWDNDYCKEILRKARRRYKIMTKVEYKNVKK